MTKAKEELTSHSPSDEKPLIAPEDYAKIMRGLELESINLLEMGASTDRKATLASMGKGGIPLHVSSHSSFEGETDVIVTHTYELTCRNRRKKCLSITATYEVGFHSTEVFTEEFFEVFHRIGLSNFVWPYFRELAQNTVTRMGLPPLVLPLIKVEELALHERKENK